MTTVENNIRLVHKHKLRNIMTTLPFEYKVVEEDTTVFVYRKLAGEDISSIISEHFPGYEYRFARNRKSENTHEGN